MKRNVTSLLEKHRDGSICEARFLPSARPVRHYSTLGTEIFSTTTTPPIIAKCSFSISYSHSQGSFRYHRIKRYSLEGRSCRIPFWSRSHKPQMTRNRGSCQPLIWPPHHVVCFILRLAQMKGLDSLSSLFLVITHHHSSSVPVLFHDLTSFVYQT